MEKWDKGMKKYQLIVEDIKKQIQNNKFSPGGKLPTENLLMDRYQVSRTTVNKAMNELEKIHLIYRKQGSGTFITKSMTDRHVLFTENNGLSAIDTELTELVNIEESHHKLNNQLLTKLDDEKVFEISRIKKVNGHPFAFHKNYIPDRYFKKFEFITAKDGISISQNFYENFQINTFNTPFEESIDITDDTSEYILDRLELSKGTPTIRFYRKSYFNDEVYEIIETYLNYKYYHLNIKTIL